MKKLFFGLLVAGVALSASAFTNAKSGTFADYYYGQTSSGVYERILAVDAEPTLNCDGDEELPCIITSDELINGPFTTLPGDASPVSNSEALYTGPVI